MKVGNYILTACFFFLCSLVSNGQNKTIDSLKTVLQTQKEDTNRVKTLIVLSKMLGGRSEYDYALKYANEASSLAKKLNFKTGQASSYGVIASLCEFRGDYAGTRNNYLAGIKIYEELNDKPGIASFTQGVAISYYREGDLAEATQILYNVLKFYEELKDKTGTANTYLFIGYLYTLDKNYSESLKNYLLSQKLFEELGNKLLIAYCKLGVGVIDAKKGNHSEALKKFSEVLKVFEEANDNMIAETHRRMGEVFEDLGAKNKFGSVNNYSRAYEHYMKSLSYWEGVKDNGSIATGYYYVGKINIALGNHQAARTYLTKALDLSKQIRSKGDLQDIYLAFSILDSSQNNYRQAHENYKMYILYRDSISNEETKKKFVRISMQYDFDKKEAAAKLVQERKRIGQWRVIASLGLLILVFLLIMFFQWKNSKQKKRANQLLQQQKDKVETTLSELRSTQSQLIQSEKMASLGELTAGIAHEIQNPLNFVNNFSEVNEELVNELKNEAAKGNLEEVKTIANDIAFNSEKITHHGKRADAIVKGMLQHSRSSSGQKEPTDINALADEYLRLAYHGLRAKDKSFIADIKTDYDDSIGKINIIPQDIGRVILNLINNAFYAVSEKQRQNLNGYEPTVSVSTKKVNRKIEISVKDNGIGIPQKVLDKIFQPFFTTKPTGLGTGLGLSLSYDIVTKGHGGELKVETKEGEGSIFRVELLV